MFKKFMKQAQVCIFPSFAETLGMVTVESMVLQSQQIQAIGWA
jgi:glycosyltransferase involved in cell wall biosynthesis